MKRINADQLSLLAAFIWASDHQPDNMLSTYRVHWAIEKAQEIIEKSQAKADALELSQEKEQS